MSLTGDRVKLLRLKKNMSQSELAAKLGIGRSNMGHIENGRVELTKESIVQLAEIFGVSTDYLLGITDNPHSGLSDEQRKMTIKEALESAMGKDGKPIDENDIPILSRIIEAYLDGK